MAAEGSASEPLSSERTDKDSWLPDGWTVEVKVRQGGSSTGMRYKVILKDMPNVFFLLGVFMTVFTVLLL